MTIYKRTHMETSQFKGGMPEEMPPLERLAGVDNM